MRMGFDLGPIKELENLDGQEGRGQAPEQNQGQSTEACWKPEEEGGRE